MTPFQRATPIPDPAVTPETIAKKYNLSIENATIALKMATENKQLFLNDKYQVAVFDDGEIIHLSIKRIDREPIHDWRELQQIKNMLVGEEHEAVEIYPKESRLVDTANQYHLWVFADPDFQLPFGFNGGRVVNDEPLGRARNRPFTKEGR